MIRGGIELEKLFNECKGKCKRRIRGTSMACAHDVTRSADGMNGNAHNPWRGATGHNSL